MQAVQYAPQRGSSCCPSCILYCLAVLTDTTVSLCPRDVMEAILSTAWDTYTLVRGTSGHRFLQQHEVFAALRLPSGIRVREMYGTPREDLASKESRSVFIGDLYRRIRDRSALVMTAQDHTTCLVRANGDLVAFDPLQASVTRLRDARECGEYIARKYPGCQEMTISEIFVV